MGFIRVARHDGAVPSGFLPPRDDLVVIRDVGPRDGLQPEQPLAVAARVGLIEALFDAGVRRVEAVSFVSPTAVPAMADAAAVLAAIERPDDAVVTALVPNAHGANDALACSVDELTVTISVSEAYNHHNVRRSVAESLDEVRTICTLAARAAVPVDAVVSCAFGSPFEGEEPTPTVVAALGDRLLDVGCAAVTYADTTGMATPRRVVDLVDEAGTQIGLHFHQTRGTALVNAFTALQLGVRRFDTSVGGLGGSPFAPGAAGNLATEDFVAVLDDVGLITGIDIDRLIDAAHLVQGMVHHDLPGAVASVGPRTRRVPQE